MNGNDNTINITMKAATPQTTFAALWLDEQLSPESRLVEWQGAKPGRSSRFRNKQGMYDSCSVLTLWNGEGKTIVVSDVFDEAINDVPEQPGSANLWVGNDAADLPDVTRDSLIRVALVKAAELWDVP